MEHQYCLFYKNDNLVFGWIKEVRKSKLIVVPEQGKEFACAPSRVEYIWKGVSYSEEKEALEHVSQQSRWAREAAESIELDIIHELCDLGVSYTLDELAENFLDDSENGWLRAALLLRLKSDQKLFQQKKSEFFARSESEIAEIEERERKRKEAQQRKAIEEVWADHLLNKERPSVSELENEHWDHFIHRFLNFVIHLERSQEKEHFCSLFHCTLRDIEKDERKLLDCLNVAGLPLSWGKLILCRSSVDFSISSDEHQAAQDLLSQSIFDSPYQGEQIDQRALETYTVDHEDTSDFDDALSWEQTEKGAILMVHITDVASFVERSSLLFEKAAHRFSSLYTIKEIYPMFPAALSEDKFSLKAGKEKGVLTFEFEINEDREIVQSDIYRSFISVDKNCTYEEIDQAIASETPYWKILWEFCQKQAEIRRAHGSLELARHEIKLDISDPENIKIKSIRENTAAALMIQELAILTNHVAARYAKTNQLPCLFRNQPPYTVSKQLGEDEKPSLKDINIQPARIGLTPEGHSALGVDCYLQITSPIRRFLDLVNQHTIMAHLVGKETSFGENSLLEWARRGEETQREFNLIERRLADHWKIKYLEQNKDALFDAEYVRTSRNGKAVVNIVPLQLMVEVSPGAVPEQSPFQVVIDSIDSSLNRIVIRPLLSDCSETMD